jgi:hypothetical protein
MGAILRFAVTVSTHGIDLQTVGVILITAALSLPSGLGRI